MNEVIFYEQPYDTTSEGLAVEAYLNRFLGIRVSGCVLQIPAGYGHIYTDNKPIRHVVLKDSKGRAVTGLRFRGRRVFAPLDGWTAGGYTLTYASGYGQLQGVLPVDVDQSFTAALSTTLSLPNDIALAMRRLGEVFIDREGSRPDVDSSSQEFGNTNYISPVYRATIPTELRGLLMNHRQVDV